MEGGRWVERGRESEGGRTGFKSWSHPAVTKVEYKASLILGVVS